MKCEKCGQEFSETVYPFHLERCQGAGPLIADETLTRTLDLESVDLSKASIGKLKEMAKFAGFENADKLTKAQLIELLSPKE